MKKLIALYLFVLALTTAAALAGTSRSLESTSTEGFYSSVNLVKDAGFESNNKAGAWTASGGTLSTTNASPARGYLTGTWDSNAAGQTLTSKLVATPAGLYNRNGVVSCLFKTGSGTATHTITVSTGAAELATPVTIPSSTSTYQRVSVNFIFPDSLSTQIKIASVAANEPLINIDDCYMGPADGFNIANISQATLVGTMSMSACSATWDKNPMTSSFAAFGNTATCTYAKTGSIDTISGATLPKITYTNAPPGEYLLLVEGYGVLVGTITANSVTSLGVVDGSTAYGEVGLLASAGTNNAISGTNLIQAHRSVTTPTTLTFELQGKFISGAAGVRIDATSTGVPLRFSLYRFPTASEQAFRPDANGVQWTSFTPTSSWVSNATHTGQYRCDGDQLQVQTNIALTGAPTAATLHINLPTGFTIDSSKVTGASAFRKIFTSSGYVRDDSAGSNLPAQVMYNDTTSVDVVMASGTTGLGGSLGAVTNTSPFTFATSDVVNVEYSVPVTASSPCSKVRAPVLVGSVTSNSNGAERVERATIAVGSNCTSGACTITQQSGSWLTSATRSATGQYDLVFAAGIFSAAPTCQATHWNGYCIPNQSPFTSTTGSISCRSVSSGNPAADTRDIHLNCQGPR